MAQFVGVDEIRLWELKSVFRLAQLEHPAGEISHRCRLLVFFYFLSLLRCFALPFFSVFLWVPRSLSSGSMGNSVKQNSLLILSFALPLDYSGS